MRVWTLVYRPRLWTAVTIVACRRAPLHTPLSEDSVSGFGAFVLPGTGRRKNWRRNVTWTAPTSAGWRQGAGILPT